MAEGNTTISVPEFKVAVAHVPIEGQTPLIAHNWSEKAKQQMRDKQQGKARVKKEPKDPEAEYNAARYLLPDGTDGFPASGFKAAIVSGARLMEGVTLVSLKQTIYVIGEGADQLVPLEIDGPPEMREDQPRIAMGTTDLRYRPQYWPWKATLRIRFVKTAISIEAIVALVRAGGMAGVGEWRPSAPKSLTGSYGTFALDPKREIMESEDDL